MDELSQQSINRDEHTLSMLYGSAAINLPLLNLTFASETNYHDVYNYDVKLSMDIALGMFPVFEPYITLGVKKHRSEINYSNDLYVQQNWQAAFVGVGVAF